jgi:hypothetical protein
MDRIRPLHAWPLGMSVLVAALPGVTVAVVIAAFALLAVMTVVMVARHGRGAPDLPADPPLQNEVLGEWFEPDDSDERAATVAAAMGAAPVATAGAWTGTVADQETSTHTTPAEAGALIASAGATGVASPAGVEALEPVAGGNGRPAAFRPPVETDAGPHDPFAASTAVMLGGSASPADAGSEMEPDPITNPSEFDYGSLERDLGFTERTGGALAVGIASVVLVILLGLWLVAQTHHGVGAPVHIVHTPIPGPPGPQGSPLP